MIGAPNSLNLNWKVRVIKEVPGPSVSEEVADIFRNYNINNNGNDNDNDDDDGNNDNNKNNNNDNNDNNDSNDNDNENNNNNNACKLWLKSRHTLCKLGTVKMSFEFYFYIINSFGRTSAKTVQHGQYWHYVAEFVQNEDFSIICVNCHK